MVHENGETSITMEFDSGLNRVVDHPTYGEPYNCIRISCSWVYGKTSKLLRPPTF